MKDFPKIESNKVEFKEKVTDDLELVEQLGSGMNRILSKYSKNIFNFSDHFIEVVFPFEQEYFSSKEFEIQTVIAGVPQVTPQVKNLIMGTYGEHSRNELQTILKLTDREYFRKSYLQAAIDSGLIEMTQPDSPNSPTQKYRLTEKGKEIKHYFESLGDEI